MRKTYTSKKYAYYMFTKKDIARIDIAYLRKTIGDIWVKRLLQFGSNMSNNVYFVTNKNRLGR